MIVWRNLLITQEHWWWLSRVWAAYELNTCWVTLEKKLKWEETAMAHRLFEEKYHASIYQKYRLIPPDRVTRLILEYLNKKVGIT